MSCETCIRWQKLAKPRASKFGRCMWPGFKPAPYWHAQHPTGDILVHRTHGAGCAAHKEKRR